MFVNFRYGKNTVSNAYYVVDTRSMVNCSTPHLVILCWLRQKKFLLQKIFF